MYQITKLLIRRILALCYVITSLTKWDNLVESKLKLNTCVSRHADYMI